MGNKVGERGGEQGGETRWGNEVGNEMGNEVRWGLGWERSGGRGGERGGERGVRIVFGVVLSCPVLKNFGAKNVIRPEKNSGQLSCGNSGYFSGCKPNQDPCPLLSRIRSLGYYIL